EGLVFIDERLGHHGPGVALGRGARVVGAEPQGHWKTTALVAALRHDRLSMLCVTGGAINGARSCENWPETSSEVARASVAGVAVLKLAVAASYSEEPRPDLAAPCVYSIGVLARLRTSCGNRSSGSVNAG